MGCVHQTYRGTPNELHTMYLPHVCTSIRATSSGSNSTPAILAGTIHMGLKGALPPEERFLGRRMASLRTFLTF